MKMKVLLSMLSLIFILLVMYVDSGHLNVILRKGNVNGTNLFEICKPYGLNEDNVNIKKLTTGSTNRTLVWVGAVVQYTPWMEYSGCGTLKSGINTETSMFEADPFKCYQKCREIQFTYEYIGMNKHFCYCLHKTHFHKRLSCKVKECDNFLCYNGDSSNLVALYFLNHTFPGNKSQAGQCGVFIYTQNKTSLGSKSCSDTSHPVCYKKSNSLNKAHGGELKNWSESMKYCDTTSPSSVEHLQNSKSPYMTFGSYWTTSIRAAKLISLDALDIRQDSTFHCLAARVSEDNKIQELVIETCDKRLPVLCLETTTGFGFTNSSDGKIEMQSTPNNHLNNNEEQDAHFPWEMIASFIGAIIIIAIIVLVIVKYRKRSLSRIEKSVAVTGINDRSPNASNEEKVESDNTNIYDASKSEEKCVMLKDSNYDSMSAIRQDTEGVYDHTNSTRNAHGKNEDLDVYDHADPVIVKQSLQIEEDGVYNQCELNIKSVSAKTHLNNDTTIYDHA
ncbi:uncharacterized protein LOC134705476 [Mytilus trossulus]|uniref:uncharacterized protein LOC134705476 n=1 Tax=Mytilus trossulus TaxID=6551 RepID=UPI003007BB7B